MGSMQGCFKSNTLDGVYNSSPSDTLQRVVCEFFDIDWQQNRYWR